MKLSCLGKTQFTRVEAYNLLSDIASGEMGTEYTAKRMYKCSLCEMYHLSSTGPETNLDSEWRKIQKDNQ